MDERVYWYLNFADVPEPEDITSKAYSEASPSPSEGSLVDSGSDIPLAQAVVGEILAQPMLGDAGCKSCCQTPDKFRNGLLAQWNRGLGVETVRLCSNCGSTTFVTRIKDKPNYFICKECDVTR